MSRRKTVILTKFAAVQPADSRAVVKFRKRDFKDAKILFSHFLEFYPDDTLGKMYLAMALEYEQSPPDEAWNAVEVFKKK